MPGREGKIRQSLVKVLEIPRDLAFDLPKIIMLGNLELSIENHNGLVEFTPEKVVVSTSQGQIEITGQRLSVRSILIYEMVIEGSISALRFI